MYDNRFHCYEEVLSMSYAALEKQLQSLPEEYYEEVSHYVEYLLFRQKKRVALRQMKAFSGASGIYRTE